MIELDLVLFEYARPLMYVFGGLFLFFIFLFISARIHWLIRFVGVPILLATALYTYNFLDRMLGYPYPGTIPDSSYYLGSKLQPLGSDMYIVIWAYPPGDNKSRLFIVPYTLQQEQELRKAPQMKKEGQVAIRQKKTDDERKNESLEEEAKKKKNGNIKQYELFLVPETPYPDKSER